MGERLREVDQFRWDGVPITFKTNWKTENDEICVRTCIHVHDALEREFTIDIDIIYKAIHSLRECDAKLIIMRMEGYSYLEIGEVLEMPLGTVKGNISRARKQITEKLSMNGVELLDKSA